jgi:seryl-tRNA synthetase
MKPLYALVALHQKLEALDPDEVDEQTLLDTMEGLEGEIDIKAHSIAAFVRNVESNAEAVREASKRMNARAARLEKKAERIKAYLKEQMEKLGSKRLDMPEFVLRVTKNPPSVEIYDFASVPARFKYNKIEVAVDKTAIKAELDAGREVPGARIKQDTRLDIKE